MITIDYQLVNRARAALKNAGLKLSVKPIRFRLPGMPIGPDPVANNADTLRVSSNHWQDKAPVDAALESLDLEPLDNLSAPEDNRFYYQLKEQ